MPIVQKDKQQLDTLFSTYRPAYGGCREDYFAVLYLTKKFGVEPEEIAHQISFGNNDYGLDAYYVDRKAGNLYLYQFKWTESHAQFKSSMERLADDGMRRVFGNSLQDPDQGELLRYLASDLAECKNLIERVFVHFVFKGDIASAEASESLRHRREDIENKQHLIEQYFGREVTLRVDFISDKPGVQPAPPQQSHSVDIADVVAAEHGGAEAHRRLRPSHGPGPDPSEPAAPLLRPQHQSGAIAG